jgi:hypothetical protein
MNIFHGMEMTNAMFEFSQYFRELNLNDTELSLVLPLQMCYAGKYQFIIIAKN